MPREKKRGDTVASSRSSSRVEKKNIVKKGEQHQQELPEWAKDMPDEIEVSGTKMQDEFTKVMETLSNKAGIKMWSEPDANTLNSILNKKNKKKLN